MIKQPITYTDYNGKTVTENFYFNLDQREMLSLEINWEGGLSAYIEKLQETSDGTKAYNLFEMLLLEAYGERSADGSKFFKEDADGKSLKRNFKGSAACPVMIMDIIGEKIDAVKLVQGLLPSQMIEEVTKQASQMSEEEKAQYRTGGTQVVPGQVVDTPLPDAPAGATGPVVDEAKKEFTDYSREELLSMSDDAFFELVGTRNPAEMDRPQLLIAMQRKSQGS